jgi:signal transduction histidine kinase
MVMFQSTAQRPYQHLLDLADRKPVVLLVEDDRDLRQGTELVLTLDNLDVVVAEDGYDALELLNAGHVRPDIIVSDIKMPRVDGYRLLDEVRKMPDIGPIPFIFLTAYGSPEFMTNAHLRGIDEYLVKPFEPEKLVVVVRNKLQRAQAFRRYAEDQLNRVRIHLIEMLSHELRTPLTTVIGGFDILQESISNPELPSTQEDIQFSINMMRIGIKRLNRVMEQTLRYSEIINGHLRLQFHKTAQAFDAHMIIKKVLDIVQPDYASREVKLEVVNQLPTGTRINAIPGALVAGLYEVLRNAAAFSQAGQVARIEISKENDDLLITVSDQGRGIRAEDVEALMNPMIQSERSIHEQQGLGLGLAIARGTVEIHRGEIALQSTWGKGTTVTVRLPIVS